MEFDSFLSLPRWKILQVIATKPSSPMEISQKVNTSMAYVSQQLKLLDAAGLVEKEKTGSFEKGQPRTLFMLSKEIAHISLLTQGFSEKKLLELTDHHKAILKIWLFTDTSLHVEIERFYYELEKRLDLIDFVFMDYSKIVPVFLIVSDSKKARSEIESYYKKSDRNFKFNFISEKEIKNKEELVTLYSKNKLEGEEKNER